jgi:NAD(P)-dependent dehydrogenase (short-subunit alcohol dehydrogenase family)
MKDFSGRVAVVTGAASGIGKSYATRCARAGMKVVLADIEEAALAKVEAEFNANGISVLAVRTDVSKASSVQALADRTLEKFGSIHLVFNNAGVVDTLGLLWERPMKDWEWVMDVNYWGVVHGIRTFTPLILAQNEEGHIVNTASIAGLITASLGIYSVTKHAVVSLSEALYFDLQKVHAKIGVSVVCPSWVQTNIMTSNRNRPDALQTPLRPLSSEEQETGAAIAALIESGASPDMIAECTFEAIVKNQFYVVTQPETKMAIKSRMEAILNEQAPLPPSF